MASTSGSVAASIALLGTSLAKLPALDVGVVRLVSTGLLWHASRLEGMDLMHSPYEAAAKDRKRTANLRHMLAERRRESFAVVSAQEGNVRRYGVRHLSALDLVLFTLDAALVPAYRAATAACWRPLVERTGVERALEFLRLYESHQGVSALPPDFLDYGVERIEAMCAVTTKAGAQA